ncbi:MAG TPA: hypothetical protein VEF89_31710 [Solirubrobacteraceae bacterium]|nr:hypothetical protein [Solirubrobacteraceae bacterium]
MLRRRFHLWASPGSVVAVVIAGEDRGSETEGVIETVRRVGAEVDVRVLLSDGGTGVARLEAFEWDWLELRVGDIVAVTALSV